MESEIKNLKSYKLFFKSFKELTSLNTRKLSKKLAFYQLLLKSFYTIKSKFLNEMKVFILFLFEFLIFIKFSL